ncbi:MAG TPA: DUF805 domain-containing protein [Flavobacteriales bacterium]|nr:DUF805 domain-containing protein [Flavobacteriales bacterium]|tara:strand:+ start:987 stop:1400 length:414 start_codon:yes stop_codon:yes gene_type:complete
MEWYLKVVRDNYANFSGRARRKELWMFVLFNSIFGIAAMILDHVTSLAMGNHGDSAIYMIYVLATLIPSLAVIVRRLHDVDKSGWMFLIPLIPLVGNIWLLVLLVTDSKPGENKWGPNPKKVDGSFDSGDITLDENI